MILGMLAFCLPDLAAQDTVPRRPEDTRQQKESSKQQQQKFVDEDGDGYNDNAPDHDGDGIPNRLDPDWKKLQKKKKSIPFEDLDGDGVNDHLQQGEGEGRQQQMQQKGREEDGSSVKVQEQNRVQKGKKRGKN
jgi:hypothetical protein